MWVLQCVTPHLILALSTMIITPQEAMAITMAHLDDMHNKMHRLDGMMKAHSEADGPVSCPYILFQSSMGLITLQEVPGDLQDIREMLCTLLGDLVRAAELMEGM